MSTSSPTSPTQPNLPRNARMIVLRPKRRAPIFHKSPVKVVPVKAVPVVEPMVEVVPAVKAFVAPVVAPVVKVVAEIAPVAEVPVAVELAANEPVAEISLPSAQVVQVAEVEQVTEVKQVGVVEQAAEAVQAAEVVQAADIEQVSIVELTEVVEPVAEITAVVTETIAAATEVVSPEASQSIEPIETTELVDEVKKKKKKNKVVDEVAPNSFAAMDLPASVQEAIVRSGYTTPSDIQAAIIPHMLAGRDIVAQSQTGSGKTAAFALPILARLKAKSPSPQVLVLAPTRELAVQVAKSFETYAGDLKGFSIAAIYGGQDYDPQLRLLRRGVSVIVGTPGRVIDHVRRGSLSLENLRCLVLDEADEMLNMGFLEDVEFVLQQCPPEKQVALFSATMPAPIRRIAEQHLNDPHTVTIQTKTMTAESINQRAIYASPKEKIELLRRLLEVEETDGVLVFTKTKESTTVVAEKLIQMGYNAAALNGDMAQRARERTIEQLKAGRLNIVVATDVAARGLDVPRISHVINFDLPHDNESYVHRIGRTGRAGRSGEAIIFLTNAQRAKLRSIERLTNQQIQICDWPSTEDINNKRIERFKTQITRTLADRDVTLYEKMIGQYVEENGTPIEKVAAALADLVNSGRPFLAKDRPKAEKASKRGDFDDRGRSSEGRGGRDRQSSDYGSEDGRPPRRLGPVRPGMQRFRVEVGQVDGVRPGNLVGAIANEAGIDSEFIGPISIQSNFTTIDLPEGMPTDIYQTLQNTWVMGKQLRLSRDTGVKSRDFSGGGKLHGGKSKGGKHKSKSGKPKHLKH